MLCLHIFGPIDSGLPTNPLENMLREIQFLNRLNRCSIQCLRIICDSTRNGVTITWKQGEIIVVAGGLPGVEDALPASVGTPNVTIEASWSASASSSDAD